MSSQDSTKFNKENAMRIEEYDIRHLSVLAQKSITMSVFNHGEKKCACTMFVCVCSEKTKSIWFKRGM